MKMPNKDIEKIGFPDSEESYPKGFNRNQSAGLPEPGSKDAQRVQTIANKMQPYDYPGDSSPLHAAHSYIQLLREHPDGIDMGTHMEGHHAIGTVHNILNHGEEYSYHPDSIQYKIEEPQEERGAGLNDNMTLEGFHRNHLRANMRADMSHNAMGLADDLHRRLRQVSPAYNPDDLGYNPMQWPASMTRSFADSAPLPPEGEGDNIRGEMKPQFPKDPQPGPHSDFKGYDRGEAWPKERYGRENRARRGDAAMESGHHADTAEFRYPSMRGRRETYRTMGGELEEPSANPSADPSAETPVPPQPKAKNAFKQRFPDLFGDEEKAMSKLMKFIRKEGDGGGDGGAFNGLSGTVFTSTNAGVFTPTFGGRGTKKKHLKNKRRQDKKREKLMGKSKKSGVDRLVQFLYDGSPNMSKGGKKGLAPGLDEDMSGAPATADAYNQNITPYQRLNWEKDVTEDTLNHKKTSRKLEDAMEVAEENEPHINMGLAGGMETGTTSTYPRHDSVNSVGNAKTARGAVWGKDNSYVQKASTEGSGNNSPDQNSQAATGPHPQALFVERTKDSPNEAPHKDAVTKENDMQRRRKQESNTEPEGSKPVAGLGLQMAYTSDYGQTDALHRGGDKDKDDPEVADEDASSYWVPETEKVAKLEAMRKELEEAGDDTPILNALLKVDYA
jgi:hypothetical protein